MKGRPANKPKGVANIHNVRFYKTEPRGILCLAYNKELKILAVARQSGVLELWDLRYAPVLDRVIPLEKNARIEALAWAGKARLFSVDLLGNLIEWDIQQLKVRHSMHPMGEKLWCLDINPAQTEMVVGSDEGYISLVGIEDDELSFKKLFKKHDGRVVRCKFNKTGTHLVTATKGALRVWNVEKGTTEHTMTMSNPDVYPLSLHVMNDFIISSSDSAGYITMWDGTKGTQLESNKLLDTHLYALAVDDKEERLACAGKFPPLIRVLAKTKIVREESEYYRWVKFLQRDLHKHSVRALAIVDDERVASASCDGMLCISSISKTLSTSAQHPSFLPGSCISLAHNLRLLLLRFSNHMELWNLGEAMSHEMSPEVVATTLFVNKMPKLLLNYSISEYLQAAAISPDGQWLCYSTPSTIKVYALRMTDKLSINPIKTLPKMLRPATHILFTKNSQQMIVLHEKTRQLRWFTLQENEITFAYKLDTSSVLSTHITHVEVSQCGQFVVAASINRTIAVWQLQEGKTHQHLLNLPRYKAATTALALHDQLPLLVVSYSDGHIIEYDLLNCRFTCETHEHFVENSRTHAIRGLLLDAKNPNIILVYNDIYLYVLEKTQLFSDETVSKMPKIKNEGTRAAKHKELRLKLKLNKEHIVEVGRLNPDELVVVGIDHADLYSSLPSIAERKKFGRS